MEDIIGDHKLHLLPCGAFGGLVCAAEFEKYIGKVLTAVDVEEFDGIKLGVNLAQSKCNALLGSLTHALNTLTRHCVGIIAQRTRDEKKSKAEKDKK